MSNKNPTIKQIKKLATEAVAHGDTDMWDICQRALSTDTTDQDGNLIAYADQTQEWALECVARAIADAAAQETE